VSLPRPVVAKMKPQLTRRNLYKVNLEIAQSVAEKKIAMDHQTMKGVEFHQQDFA
jgi:hypothetical protein